MNEESLGRKLSAHPHVLPAALEMLLGHQIFIVPLHVTDLTANPFAVIFAAASSTAIVHRGPALGLLNRWWNSRRTQYMRSGNLQMKTKMKAGSPMHKPKHEPHASSKTGAVLAHPRLIVLHRTRNL